MGDNPQSHANNAVVAAEQARCFELKLQGWSYRRIAKEMGLSLGTVSNRIKDAIAERVDPLVEEYRAIELEKLEEAERPLWEQVLSENPRDRGRLARNVEVLIKVSERRSKLVGMDAPEKQEIAAQVEHKPAEVLSLIEQAKQRVAAEEADLIGRERQQATEDAAREEYGPA